MITTIFTLAVPAVVISLMLGWRRMPEASDRWNLRAISANYTQLTVTLAGFAVASVFFLTAESTADGYAFPTIAGLLVLSYLILTGAAIMFGTIAHISSDSVTAEVERTSFLFAVLVLMQGVAVAWIAIHPLLILVELGYLAKTFSWILFAALFIGSARPGVFLHELGRISTLSVITVPIIGFTLAVAYHLVQQARGNPPSVVDQVQLFGSALFVLALIGFTSPQLFHLLLGKQITDDFWERWSHRILLAYYQLVVLTIAVLTVVVVRSQN